MNIDHPCSSKQQSPKTWADIVNLRNLFLYLVVVVMPISGIYFFLYDIALERFQAERLQLVRKLELQSAKIPEYARPEFQLNDFLDRLFSEGLAGKSPQFIANFIDHIDVLYPEAFSWLIWNQQFLPVAVASRASLAGQRVWTSFVESVIAERQQSNVAANYQAAARKTAFARSVQTLERGLGDPQKLDQLRDADKKVVRIEWFGRPALLAWRHGSNKEAAGGMLIIAYLDQLSKDIWVKRMIDNLHRYEAGSLPVAAVNISNQTVVAIDDKYSQSQLGLNLLNSYLMRSHHMLEFDTFLARASKADSISSLRLISFADRSIIDELFARRLLTARFVVLLMLLLSSFYAIKLYRSPRPGMDMRRRIAFIFMIAVFLPIMSLVNIGRRFLHIEESRLIESALVEMRADLEGIDLRFGNTPWMLQNEIFAGVKDLQDRGKLTYEGFLDTLYKAIEQGLIHNFVIHRQDGTIEDTSWEDMHPTFRTSMSAAARSHAKRELDAFAAEGRSAEFPVHRSIKPVFEDIEFNYEFSRPTRMTLFTFQEENHYLMSITLRFDDVLRTMFVQLPDYYLEKIFVEREFGLNSPAGDDNAIKQAINGKTVIFYSTRPDYPSLPEKISRFEALGPFFERAHELGVEESGQVKIADHGILYVIRVLESMNSKSYVPAVLMTTDPIYKRLDRLNKIFILLVAAAIIGALFLSFTLASSLITPIAGIDSAVKDVSRGNLNLRLPYMGADELGRLSQTFNMMIKGLREREKMEAYVSDTVIEAVKEETGSTRSSLGAGQDINASILFASIRNFTGIIEKYQPDVVFALLNEFLGGVEPIIRHNGGRVDKFIGDAVMAVFHAGDADEHAKKAVKAAVDMKNFVKNLNYKRKNQHLFTIEIGTGISTGKVMMGDIGSATRKDLTVIGDEVNLASRLESASRNGIHSCIVISDHTNSFVGDYVVTELMPFSEVKGKQEPVKLFEIVKLRL